jgi:hypothetical protein
VVVSVSMVSALQPSLRSPSVLGRVADIFGDRNLYRAGFAVVALAFVGYNWFFVSLVGIDSSSQDMYEVGEAVVGTQSFVTVYPMALSRLNEALKLTGSRLFIREATGTHEVRVRRACPNSRGALTRKASYA